LFFFYIQYPKYRHHYYSFLMLQQIYLMLGNYLFKAESTAAAAGLFSLIRFTGKKNKTF
jgi:hypothetical protein